MPVQKRAYKFRFYPTEEQKVLLAKEFGCNRYVYNYFLDRKQKLWKDKRKNLTLTQMAAELKELKLQEQTAWLKEVSSVNLQQSLRHLDTAYSKFFKKQAKYPKFKKRDSKQSANYMRNAFTFNEGKITLAKQKMPLDIRFSRCLPKETSPSSLTVSKDASGRYHISILMEEEIRKKAFVKSEVGIDFGLKSLLTTNQEVSILPPKFLEKQTKKLRRLQRSFSRKKKASNSKSKLRLIIARLHGKIRDKRLDYCHKLSTKLIDENQVIVLENLSIQKMQKKSKSLAKSIADASWGLIRQLLEYKSLWYGRSLVLVDRFFPSSQKCFHCKKDKKDLRLSDRSWKCSSCGNENDRDVNAAKNILHEGLRLLADKSKMVPQGLREPQLAFC